MCVCGRRNSTVSVPGGSQVPWRLPRPGERPPKSSLSVSVLGSGRYADVVQW